MPTDVPSRDAPWRARDLCKRGEDHYHAKLSDGIVRQSFELAAEGRTAIEIVEALDLDATPGAILRVIRRESWAHVEVDPQLVDRALEHRSQRNRLLLTRRLELEGLRARMVASRGEWLPIKSWDPDPSKYAWSYASTARNTPTWAPFELRARWTDRATRSSVCEGMAPPIG